MTVHQWEYGEPPKVKERERMGEKGREKGRIGGKWMKERGKMGRREEGEREEGKQGGERKGKRKD